MRLTRAAIAQPFLTALLTAALLIAGMLGWNSMPVDLNPRTDLPTLIVTAVYPGAGPSTVERQVAEPLEAALRTVAAVRAVNSVSQESFAALYVELDPASDVDEASEDCRQAIDAARATMPEAVSPPATMQLDINAQPVVTFALTGTRPLGELRRLADDLLRPLIESVDGVASVEILGGREPEVAIEVHRAALAAAGLTLGDLLQPLEASSVNAPGGRLREGQHELEARLAAEFESLEAIRQVPLPPPPEAALGELLAEGLRPRGAARPRRAVRLGDLAEVRLAEAEPEVLIRFDGREAVGLVVTKRGTANTVALSRDVRRVVRGAGLPDDVRVLTARDSAATVREALADVNASIVLGILLCSGTILLFLRNLRGTLIVSTAIPVCLLGTFAPMSLGGHTLNQMTLLGLALSVGILVDDSIVCMEAILYRMRRGEPAAEAAFNGRNDIALADTSTTLIDLAVFAPIAVMPGLVGQFFHDFGFVVATAAALSLLAAYTVVPSLTARTYRDRPPVERPPWGWYTRLERRYEGTLRWALAHRRATLLGGWTALAAAGLLAYAALGVDFIPAADLGLVQVNLELEASAGLGATTRVVERAEAVCRQVAEVETTLATIGRIEAGFGKTARRGPQTAQLSLTLKDRRGLLDVLLLRGFDLRRRSDGAVADDLRRRLRVLPGVLVQVVPVRGWGGAGAPLDVSLYGADLGQMAAAGELFLARLRSTPGIHNADRSWRLGQPEVRVELDRAQAAELHLFPGAVARELRVALTGETNVGLRLDGERIAVRLRLRALDRRNAADLAALPVGRGGARALVLGDVATITAGTGPTRIDRRNGLRDLNFKAHLAEGHSLGAAQDQIEAIWAELGVRREDEPPLPGSRYPTLRWGWRGDAATMADSVGPMAGCALVGLALVYVIMAVLFGSPVHPLTVLSSVPMAATGALLLLVLSGSTFSMVAGIGMILLIGIVTRNAILLLDHTLQSRRRGVPRHEAVILAGVRRLRPILMTTLTTILGMAPVALRLGKGAEIRAPMAIAVIGGLALSTLLTLVIVPVTYTLFDDWAGRPPVGGGRALEPLGDDDPRPAA